MTNTITADPATFPMGPEERLDLLFDFTLHLEAEETVESATVTLTQVHSKRAFADGIDGDPTVNGSTVLVWVHQLKNGQNYQLDCTALTSSGRSWTLRLRLPCPY